ncbi:HAMP domain-containing sensor histidine kinase [Nocardia australiensis]|uniref:HAMP domain-containing sensor histidine kinase n=1 Tax=Nocardia australiensis TaxID=2887191 RepID=UPI001D13E165|nr:ATP-binding protein [Nocardia australiensis]
MAQGSVARTRWRNLEQWRVRWKVTAAVALPLAAAMLLGGLRLSASFGNYSDFNDAADRISDIPAITALESAASTVSFGQVYGSATDEDLVELSATITEATLRAGRSGIDPAVATALRQMTATSEIIRAGGKAAGDPLEAVGLNNTIVNETVSTIEKLLAPTGISRIVTARTQLLGVFLGKAQGFKWLMAAMSAMQNPKLADEFDTAQGSYLATNSVIERELPSSKTELGVIRANNAVLKGMVDQAIQTGDVDSVQLRRLVIESRDMFTELAHRVVEGILADVDSEVDAARSAWIQSSIVVLATLVAALGLAVLVARSLLRPLRRLRAGAAKLADRDLPDEVERISRGTHLEQIVVTSVPVHTGEEIGEIAGTVDRLHAQALKLAAQQQLLRDQVNDMFVTMARRSQTLVDRQLSMIDALEFEEKDPERLDQLFRLDHLAARMRRNSANLLVLAGTKARHDRSGPVEVRDILRAALSEVEDYQRVKAGATPDGWVIGAAATDMVHLIAELLENALRASPPDTDVTFAYSRTSEGGLLVEVIDKGIGIGLDELDDINRRLSTSASATLATTRQMGIFVVGRLAERHGITVRLRRTQDRASNPGITASLHIPATLIAVASQDLGTPGDGQPVIPVHRDAIYSATGADPVTPKSLQPKPIRPRAIVAAPTARQALAAGAVANEPRPEPEPGPEPKPPAAEITSYGLPKRVPGANRRGRRKPGGGLDATTTSSTPLKSAASASPSTSPSLTGHGMSADAPTAKIPLNTPGAAAPASPADAPAAATPASPANPEAAATTAPSGTVATPVNPTAEATPANPPNPVDHETSTGPTTSTTSSNPAGAATSAIRAGTAPSANPTTGAASTVDSSATTPVTPASTVDPATSRTAANPTAAGSSATSATTATLASPGTAATSSGSAAALPSGSATTAGAGTSSTAENSATAATAPTTEPATRSAAQPTATPNLTAAQAHQRRATKTASFFRRPRKPSAAAPTDVSTTGEQAAPTPPESNPCPAQPNSPTPPDAPVATNTGTSPASAPSEFTSPPTPPVEPASSAAPPESRPAGPTSPAQPLPSPPHAAHVLSEFGSPTMQPEPRPASPTTPTPATQSALATKLPEFTTRTGESESQPGKSADQPPQTAAGGVQTNTRSTRSASTGDESATTPIFAGMISAWLTDPVTSQEEASVSWNSAADEGWSAARRAADQPVTERTKSGLPQREPGNLLVPGGAETGTEHSNQARPDPESIRAGLNRYDRGVRDGRATRTSKPFAAEDIR